MSKLLQIDDKDIMVRVDKTMKEVMEEKPDSRLDPEYWHIKYDQLFKKMTKSKYEVVPLNNYILPGTEGITYGQVGERHYSKKGAVQYLQVSNITPTGIDIYAKDALIETSSHNDPLRSRLKENDILLLNGGVGSLGRSCILLKKDREYNISQDIDRIRVRGIDPIYVVAFLNSSFGQQQIERFQKGVSGQIKIGFEHVRAIKILVIPERIQNNIASEYRRMHAYHEKAMQARVNKDNKEYQHYKEIAESMLGDLIMRTEAFINGDREDVV